MCHSVCVYLQEYCDCNSIVLVEQTVLTADIIDLSNARDFPAMTSQKSDLKQ